MASGDAFGIEPSDRLYIMMPMYHSAGGILGASQILIRGFFLPKNLNSYPGPGLNFINLGKPKCQHFYNGKVFNLKILEFCLPRRLNLAEMKANSGLASPIKII
jgi:acyl-CoA synthetase (AMP-forming)/AMP-acid ligase II